MATLAQSLQISSAIATATQPKFCALASPSTILQFCQRAHVLTTHRTEYWQANRKLNPPTVAYSAASQSTDIARLLAKIVRLHTAPPPGPGLTIVATEKIWLLLHQGYARISRGNSSLARTNRPNSQHSLWYGPSDLLSSGVTSRSALTMARRILRLHVRPVLEGHRLHQ